MRVKEKPRARRAERINVKKALLAVAKDLAEDATFDDVVEQLLVLAGIQRGLDDVAAGRVIPAEKVFARIRKKYRLPRPK